MAEGDRYLTVSEASKVLGVHTQSILRWCRTGKLKAVRAGNRWRILESDLLRPVSVIGSAAHYQEFLHKWVGLVKKMAPKEPMFALLAEAIDTAYKSYSETDWENEAEEK